MAPKQQRLDLGYFHPISKQESDIDTERAFATLAKSMEKERAMPIKKIFKRPVGRLRKEIQATLLIPKVETMKPTIKK